MKLGCALFQLCHDVLQQRHERNRGTWSWHHLQLLVAHSQPTLTAGKGAGGELYDVSPRSGTTWKNTVADEELERTKEERWDRTNATVAEAAVGEGQVWGILGRIFKFVMQHQPQHEKEEKERLDNARWGGRQQQQSPHQKGAISTFTCINSGVNCVVRIWCGRLEKGSNFKEICTYCLFYDWPYRFPRSE